PLCCVPNLVVPLSGDAIHNIPLPSPAHFAPVECCFKYAQKRIRHPQVSQALIVAANGDEICADPKKDWVNKIIKRLQNKTSDPSTI
uniref:Uncharacterized protein n=1 Tax=Geospiza parvula TaxID=87175 RepID=A0A8C3MS01_GEOPR